MTGILVLTRVRRVLLAARARAVVGVCLAVAVALVAPAAAAAAAPPATLTGEEFLVPNPPPMTICQQSGTVSYTASGTATGPYSGTFTETGTAAGNAGTGPIAGNLTSLSASFTIYSSNGAVRVRGTTKASTGFYCQQSPGSALTGGSPAYQATIFTANGTYSDQGTSALNLSVPSPMFFEEDFASSLTQPVLISPTSKADCMNGGWQNFGTSFKNQGQCVSFVATGGKHAPTG